MIIGTNTVWAKISLKEWADNCLIKYLKISYTLLGFEIGDWIELIKYLSVVIAFDHNLKSNLIRINDLKNIYSSYQI